MTIIEDVSPSGFSYSIGDRTMGQRRSISGEFRAPYVVQYGGIFPDSGRRFDLTAMLVPSKPGWSRITILQGDQREEPEHDEKEKQSNNNLLKAVFNSIPIWLVHQFSNRFLDSDLAFLHFQELEVQRGREYFMPAEADICIVAWRKWLKEHGIVYGNDVVHPQALPESILFDRYEQHTKHCRHCREALEGIQSNRRFAVIGLVASVLLWQVVEPVAQVGAVFCICFIALSTWLEQSFQKGGFDHATND